MQYKIIVDKQSRTNPSDEKKEYLINIEELRIKGDVYDSLIITTDETYVMRRLSLSKYHVLSVLDEPVKESLTEVDIELFEGDNYIYLEDMTGNTLCAEYIIKNDFTDIYCTKNEMNSAISQSASQIELSVSQKLEGYSTTEEMNSVIALTSTSILNSVSASYLTQSSASSTYATQKSVTASLELKVDIENLISEINASADVITLTAR